MNAIFIVLHLVCFLVFWPGLLLTIPLHIIAANQRAKEAKS